MYILLLAIVFARDFCVDHVAQCFTVYIRFSFVSNRGAKITILIVKVHFGGPLKSQYDGDVIQILERTSTLLVCKKM